MADITIKQVTAENLPQFSGPLWVLESKPGLSQVHKYPSNLGNKADSNEKNHWVTFRIFDIEPASIRGANTGLADTTQQNTVNAKKDNAAQKQTAQGFQDLATMFKQFSDKMRYIAGGLGRA